MKLLTEEIRRKIPPLYSQENVKDPIVHVKFFTPWTNWTWYATEFDGKDVFFGWVVGLEKELGYFSLSEMESIRGPGGIGIERDMYFTSKPLSQVMAEHGEKWLMPQVRPPLKTDKKGPLFPHRPKSKEPQFPHRPKGSVPRLPQTIDLNGDFGLPLTFSEVDDDGELWWEIIVSGQRVGIEVRGVTGLSRRQLEDTFAGSIGRISSLVVYRELPFASATREKIWWLAAIRGKTVQVEVSGIWGLSERQIEDAFVNSWATIFIATPTGQLLPEPLILPQTLRRQPSTISGNPRDLSWETEWQNWGLKPDGWRPESYPEEYYELSDLTDMKRLLFMAYMRGDALASQKAQTRPDLLEDLTKKSEEFPRSYDYWAGRELIHLRRKRARR